MDMVSKVFLITGICMALVWIVVYLVNFNRFDAQLRSVPKEEYHMIRSMVFGFGVLRIIRFNPKNPKYTKTLKQLGNLHDRYYAEYYLHVLMASRITFVWLLLMAGFLISGIAATPALIVVFVLLAGLGILYRETTLQDSLQARERALVSEFPNVVSKMTLLAGAGFTLREAWAQIAANGEGILYDEMQMVVQDKQNGKTDEDAYGGFGDRCGVKEIRKFAMSMVQNMQKGNREQVEFLKDMSSEIWEVKKKLVKKRVEDMKSLLLIPTFLVFIGILIMVMGPMVSGITASF